MSMTIGKRRSLVAAIACCLLLWGAAPASAAKDYVVEPVLSGLDRPWSLSFLPDGAMLLTGHKGSLWIVRDGKLSAPVSGVPVVEFAGQGGLFEALPHPGFAENRLVYLSYAHKGEGGNALRVARARLDGGALKDLKVIFESKPARATAVHYGGRMAWLPDGTLLVTGGDGFNYREKAQDLASDFGKIVRLNDDGTIPADNPFAGRKDARPEIWSYGHRNAQGIVFDPASGVLYIYDNDLNRCYLTRKVGTLGQPLLQRLLAGPLLHVLGRHGQSLFHSVYQRVVRKRFFAEIERTALDGVHRSGHIGMA